MNPFIDTNVLVYFTGEGEKAATAEALIVGGGIISVQVLNEMASVCRRKYDYSWEQIHQALLFVRTLLNVVPITLETHELGLSLAERYRLRLFDSLLLAAALLEGCSVFWSEDMQEGLIVERTMTIRNPFR
ncbi:MAG TPA: PIN domain-containing protein [Allosphingosinicella sp.]